MVGDKEISSMKILTNVDDFGLLDCVNYQIEKCIQLGRKSWI